MSDWDTFLKSVDDDDPGEVVIRTVKDFLEKAGFSAPGKVVGVTDAEILNLPAAPTELPVRAFISRTITAISIAAEVAKASKAVSPLKTSPGGSTSALALAASMAAPSKATDTKALLSKAGLSALPFDYQAEPKVWDLLSMENELAVTRGNKAFTYVELTSKEMLPIWMSPEDVGGKLQLHDADALDAGSSTSDLQSLGRALRTATETPRFFRAIGQWQACWTKYSDLALPQGQLTWAHSAMHSMIICQLSERERAAGNGPFAAFLYDELLRKQLAHRAARHDTIDLDVTFATIDKQLWDTVQQRLAGVLTAAGIKKDPAHRSGPSAGDGESIRIQAAAEAAKKSQERAEKASQALAKQQEELLRRARAMGESKGKGGGKGDSKGGKSRKDLKTAAWNEKQNARRQSQEWKKRQKRSEWDNDW